MHELIIETFPALASVCRHAFLGRATGLDVAVDREAALERLAGIHERARRELGLDELAFMTAEQVHGNSIAVVRAGSPSPSAAVDALVTDDPQVCLGIYVADCCAVYAVDPVRGCIGLAHSGKKGTELGIVPVMLEKMQADFGADPAQMIVQLSPCIRPPQYETDFAAEIVRQCREAGVGHISDSGQCTASDPQRYYSYRREKGRTGRMLALLALRP